MSLDEMKLLLRYDPETPISEKNKIIREKFDELIQLILTHDLNNVGMPWPGDVHRANILKGLKEAYK